MSISIATKGMISPARNKFLTLPLEADLEDGLDEQINALLEESDQVIAILEETDLVATLEPDDEIVATLEESEEIEGEL